jgi:hypothetical protein
MEWKSKIYKQKSRLGEEIHWLELSRLTLIIHKFKDDPLYYLHVNDGECGGVARGWTPTLELAKEKIIKYR